MAQNSGIHMMSFLQILSPILHANGRSSTLLAHSMGNLALQSGVENWFLHGNAADKMFNLSLLAAADCRYDLFDLPPPGGLSRLSDLSERISIYYSQVDDVLKLSMVVNFQNAWTRWSPQHGGYNDIPPQHIYYGRLQQLSRLRFQSSLRTNTTACHHPCAVSLRPI